MERFCSARILSAESPLRAVGDTLTEVFAIALGGLAHLPPGASLVEQIRCLIRSRPGRMTHIIKR